MSGKSKSKRDSAERYLKIPYFILNLRGIGLCQKILLAHIYSFGQKGCYQSNKILAEIFMVSPNTISRWIAHVRKYLYVKNPKGYYRTMWAKAHPDVQAAAVLTDRKRQSIAEIERFKSSFGRQVPRPLTQEEFERRRQRMRKALLAS